MHGDDDRTAGWLVRVVNGDIPHVYPADDLRPHDLVHDLRDGTLTVCCWCKPCWIDGIVIHHSADHREDDDPGRHVCNQPTGEA